jgi:PadR family transcriptional regulator PadR
LFNKVLSITFGKIRGTYMNLENTQVQMRKGILEFCILHIISRGEVYASDMLEELTSARIMVVEGTLYPLLTRLRKAELVDYRWEESASGPPRKYYTLTQAGAEFLQQLTSTWEELMNSTNQIINNTKNRNGA